MAEQFGLPQSAVSSNLQVLEDAGLVTTESRKARKGSQKICRTAFTEILAGFRDDLPEAGNGAVEVSMPIGLYTPCEVTGLVGSARQTE